MSDTAQRVCAHIQKFYGDPAGKTVTPETKIDDIAEDSLDRTELIIHLESEFGVRLPDERWDQCETVAQLIEEVERAKGAAG